jgi:hypothetical protein
MENISCSDKHIQSKLKLSTIRVSVTWLVACGQLCTEPTAHDRALVFCIAYISSPSTKHYVGTTHRSGYLYTIFFVIFLIILFGSKDTWGTPRD